MSLTQIGLPWDVGTITKRYRYFRYYPIPSMYGTEPNPSLLGGFSVGIFKGGIHNEDELAAAWKWLKFLFQKRTQYPLSFSYNVPTRKDAQSHLENLPGEINNVIFETIKTAHPQFDFKNIRSVLAFTGNELLQCFERKITPEECQKKILNFCKTSVCFLK